MMRLTTETLAAELSDSCSAGLWLGYNRESGKLQIAACPNQDPLDAITGLVPLFGIDVWEHAYYLQYKSLQIVANPR